MESVIALEGDGYVMIAADVSTVRSIVVMKDDMDKIREMDDYKLFAAVGTPGDVSKFTEHVQKDVRLYNMRSGITMSTAAMANYTRGEIAKFLRRAPYQCNMLMAGYDAPPNADGPSLYSCDYLGTLVRLKFAAEGYAQYFVLSTLDRYWKKNLSAQDGLIVIKKCIAEIQKRLVINQPRFIIKMVSKDGIKVLDMDSATLGKATDAMMADTSVTQPASA